MVKLACQHDCLEPTGAGSGAQGPISSITRPPAQPHREVLAQQGGQALIVGEA